MARKTNKADYVGVVDWPLNSNLDAMVDELPKTNPDFVTHLMALCQDGYELTFRYDERSETYTCFLKCILRGHANAGWWLPGTDTDWLLAAAVVFVKHFHAFENEVWDSIPAEARKKRR